MFLAVDVGNTNIVLGLFGRDELVKSWRLRTIHDRTADEFEVVFRDLWAASGHRLSDIDGAGIACVVPPVLEPLTEALHRSCGVEPLVVGPGVKTGLPILLYNPKELGADRVVNAVAAYTRHKAGLIIVDFGTATTFDCVSPKGEYLGGAIAPGLRISANALIHATAQLPDVEISKPQSVVGRSTVEGLKSGLFHGYVALVDGLVEKLKAELGFPCRVMATGGLASLISAESKTIEEVDPLLTLNGIRLIFEMNR